MMPVVHFLLLLPRNVAILILKMYRAIISPFYGDVCRYYPSCSHYTLQSIQRYGLARGGALAGLRVMRCHPWAEGGVDDVPDREGGRYVVTRMGFVRFDGSLQYSRVPRAISFGSSGRCVTTFSGKA